MRGLFFLFFLTLGPALWGQGSPGAAAAARSWAHAFPGPRFGFLRGAQPLQVAVAGFTDAKTGLVSPASSFLTAAFEQALAPGTLVRGPRPPLAAPPPEARPNALLGGRVFLEGGGGLRVDWSLTDPLGLRVLASETLVLGADDLPPGLSLVPLVPAGLPAVPRNDPALTLSLALEAGDPATYHDGDSLVLTLRASADCWVKVYHLGADGQIQVVFPNPYDRNNRLSGGQAVQVPSAQAGFALRLGPPWGTETLRAVASTVPFADLEPAFADLGPTPGAVLARGLAGTNPGASTAHQAQVQVQYRILPAP